MPIDAVMLEPVRHYLMQMVLVAKALYSEADELSLNNAMPEVKEQFLANCRGMQATPVPEQYSHQTKYELTVPDRKFLEQLEDEAREADWRNPHSITRLELLIDGYAHSEFRG